MKGLFASLAMLCALCVALPAAQAKPIPGAKYTYTLKSVMPVAGRQGVACDGKFIYVSCSKALYKYDMNGKLVAENKKPFEGYSIPSNHIGDIDVYNGEIYVGAENFMDGVGKDIQIAIHDANTLKFKRTFKFEPKSGQEEVSGITVDPVKKTVWMCSWVGEESGRHLYEYDLKGNYLRKVHLQPVPQWVQGVFYYNGSLFMTADDGTADDNEPDHLYRIDITSDSNAHVYMEKVFDEAIKQGEIEGLCVDPSTGDLLVHMNRGARIVLGMGKGFYPGYTEEVHEIYRYSMEATAPLGTVADQSFRAAFGRPFFVPASLDAACPARYAHASNIPQETGMDLHKILLISLGHLSCDLNGGALPSLMPYLAAAHGFNYQAAGALMFAYSATSSLVQPVFGYLADKYARSWFVPLAVLLAGGSLGLVGFLDSYWAIFLTLMLCGVGGALFHPEGARYANLVSGDRKGAGMSIFSVGGNSGFVVGPLLVAGATFVAGLHGTAVFLLLALCTASFLFFQMRGWQRQIPQSRAAVGQAEPRNDWHAFGVLTLVIASRSILFLGFNTYIPMYWHDVFGQSKEFGAMMLAFFCVCGVSSNVLGGFLADRIGYARIIRLSWWLALPAALAFAWVDSMWLAALLLAPLAVGLFAPFSSMVVLGQKLLARNMGFASGVTLGLPMTLGGMAMPLLGWIADNFGGLGTAMACLVPVAALGALASLRLRDDAAGDRA